MAYYAVTVRHFRNGSPINFELMMSIAGLFCFTFLLALFSSRPSKVQIINLIMTICIAKKYILVNLKTITIRELRLHNYIIVFKIRWRTVIWGYAFQFVFGLMLLRWETGRKIIGWASSRVIAFSCLTHTSAPTSSLAFYGIFRKYVKWALYWH